MPGIARGQDGEWLRPISLRAFARSLGQPEGSDQSMEISQVASSIIQRVPDQQEPRLLLAGPCGVGKTSISTALISEIQGLCHIEHDALKPVGIKARSPSPCSVGAFDPEECFGDQISALRSGFVIDIGGGAVFRPNGNNEVRLSKMRQFKAKHSLFVVLLQAAKGILRDRFTGSKNRNALEFDAVWTNWQICERPYWSQLSDLAMDVGK